MQLCSSLTFVVQPWLSGLLQRRAQLLQYGGIHPRHKRPGWPPAKQVPNKETKVSSNDYHHTTGTLSAASKSKSWRNCRLANCKCTLIAPCVQHMQKGLRSQSPRAASKGLMSCHHHWIALHDLTTCGGNMLYPHCKWFWKWETSRNMQKPIPVQRRLIIRGLIKGYTCSKWSVLTPQSDW